MAHNSCVKMVIAVAYCIDHVVENSRDLDQGRKRMPQLLSSVSVVPMVVPRGDLDGVDRLRSHDLAENVMVVLHK